MSSIQPPLISITLNHVAYDRRILQQHKTIYLERVTANAMVWSKPVDSNHYQKLFLQIEWTNVAVQECTLPSLMPTFFSFQTKTADEVDEGRSSVSNGRRKSSCWDLLERISSSLSIVHIGWNEHNHRKEVLIRLLRQQWSRGRSKRTKNSSWDQSMDQGRLIQNIQRH